VEPPTRSSMVEKLGIVSQMQSRPNTIRDRKAARFHVNSKHGALLSPFPKASSNNDEMMLKYTVLYQYRTLHHVGTRKDKYYCIPPESKKIFYDDSLMRF
jgi:hypothetical protein